MSDETNALTGAPPAAPVENAPEANPQENTAPSATAEGQNEPTKDERPRDEKGRFVQERINELTRARRQAERERDAYAEQLQHYQSQRQAPPDQPPTLEACNYDQAEFSRALTAYAVEQATKAVQSQRQQQDTQRSQEAIFESFGKREREYAAKHPDYNESVADLGRAVRFSPPVIEAIGSMEAGPAVLHHLATHLDEADRISRMPPHIAALHLGRMERELAAPKAKPVSNAPPPAPVVGGASTVSKDPDRMPIEEWVRWRRDQLKAK